MKTFVQISILISILLSLSAWADRVPSPKDIVAAKDVVSEYKALRKTCAASSGEERKACFKVLNEANADYQAAKKSLASLRAQDDKNLHLVSQVY